MYAGKWLICAVIIMIIAQSGCSDDGTGPLVNDDPVCGLSTTLLEFGSVIFGGTSDQTFIITNTGVGTLTGTISESSDEYEIIGDASYSLDAGVSDTFTVRFTPTSLGIRMCELGTGSDFCDVVQCTGIGGAHYYADASSGLDTNPGTSEEPFKTITHAVSIAGTDNIIGVLPGTYDAALGETFPIRPKQGQSLIGDIPNKGLGAVTTTIYGSGDASPIDSYLSAIVGADQAMVAGFDIGAPYTIRTFGIYLADVVMTIKDNSFTSTTTNLYGGIRARGTGATMITRNDFLTSAYGVYSNSCTGGMIIEANDFLTMSIPVDVVGDPNNTIIRGNTFVGTGQIGVQVQHGVPLIEDNVFNNPGGYSNYGAVRCQGATANPTIRSNTFICARGIRIDNALSPDMGTAGDPGENDFSGVTVESIYHMGTAFLNAIGNTWPHASPICGTDIVLTSSGTITWGTGLGEECP
ncbi:MAG: DUF1565 domain-containing protein [Candidatus Krumholzibacteria bacterium]|nr:DUF1565 domain-containing protein [Candidatus Krumholzibacteria bacterium]